MYAVLKRLWDRVRPLISPRMLWAATVGAGIVGGMGGYTFVYSRGFSYLSNRPEVCANCHVMQAYYDGWARSSHHGVAVCNDCHAPHDWLGKYRTKAENGWHHSVAFTSGNYPVSLRIRPKNARIVEDNCLRCHEELVEEIDGHGRLGDDSAGCVRCHSGVGHGIE